MHKRLVREARAKLGMKTQEFAERLGIARMTVWRYEHGDPVPKHMQIAINALLTEYEQEEQTS